jgi:2-polyprenyl-3-methyl-5-hydroxy-6-metoxy-1,4-benzoquinol methylase
MKLPQKIELQDPDARYLYLHDTKELFGRKSWERYVYMNRFCTIIDFIRRMIRKDSVVIDIGCAQGNFALVLAKLGYKICGVDLRSSFIAYAKLKMLRCADKIAYVNWAVIDAKNLPFRRDSVDCVLLLEILEHTAMPEKMIEEACRILKKGGCLIVSTVNQKRIRRGSKSISYSDFKKSVSKKVTRIRAESTAKGSEHLFEFQMAELLILLHKFGFKIVNVKWMTYLGFHFLSARLLDYNILSILERIFLKPYIFKEKFAMGLVFFCLKC